MIITRERNDEQINGIFLAPSGSQSVTMSVLVWYKFV